MFLIVPNAATASMISQRLYELSVATNQPGRVTVRLVSYVVHPETGQAALNLPDDVMLPIKESAAGVAVSNALGIDGAEIAAIRNSIVDARGTRVPVVSLLPARLQNLGRTHEQLQADGWFVEPTL